MKPLKIVSLKGEVFSGSGEGARFIELPWVKQQIIEKIGFIPYSGTLNIELTKNNLEAQNSLKKAKGIEIIPARGFCRGKCFRTYMDYLKCAIVIPEVEGYAENVVEIIASVNLRKTLNLKDGDIVEVEVILE